MIKARIAGIDPGQKKSSFAMVGIEVVDQKIYIRGARAWNGKAYLQVENDVAKIHEKKPFDYYIVEKNNVGVHVIEVLKYVKHLPIISVTTSKDIRNPEQHPNVMDKNDMTKWMLILHQQGDLVFPSLDNKHTAELKRQLSLFEEHKTGAGTVSYSATKGERDDMVMALMLACYVARERYLKVGSGEPVLYGSPRDYSPTEYSEFSDFSELAARPGVTINDVWEGYQ